jgi:peptidyl-prolyl cis-trans isomerase C
MIAAPGVTVNGIKISIEQINAEVQYHPSQSLADAKHAAMRALVVRELLIQKAIHLNICTRASAEGREDDVIEELLKDELTVPEPSMEECERYYAVHRAEYASPPIFEASHILYLAPPEDAEAREAALTRASAALDRLKDSPNQFSVIAERESACPSAKQGGNLGQISPGQTLPAFEAALAGMKAGEVSAIPVETDVGFHLIRLERRLDGEALPFKHVAGRVAEDLKRKSWYRSFSQYVQLLAAGSEISGFRLKSADSPLVQ